MANEPEPSANDIGRVAARQLAGGEWQVEVPDESLNEGHESLIEVQKQEAQLPSSPKSRTPRPAPPAPEQLAEAMLFVGGHPLSAEAFRAVLRVPNDIFHTAIDTLNRKYKAQHRPYSIQPRDGGYVLAVRPQFRGLREKLFGGPREARLTQSALDVLALVAYRQPVSKSDVDALRGHDSAAVLRQLVRLGLVAVTRRGESGRRDVCYGTTPRFLDVFRLGSLDDLPRLGDAEPV